ncbi:MAG: lycopene cyclase [Paracoccus denitrificans]|nr:MAG: lycopene cyclase [Paracoccus denitrificans]PZO84794.1 MAG: lycopene cyclase [Paracoccus denitrificans]
MTENRPDIVIAGAGLAASLAALRVGADAQVLMIDPSEEPLAGHTWSFHDDDLTPAQRVWIGPAIRTSWPGQDVRFPGKNRQLRSGYASLDGDSLGSVIRQMPNVAIRRGKVARVDPDAVVLSDGTRITAPVAIDARGYRAHPAAEVRFQKFLGQELLLSVPHGLSRPVIMDATVAQDDGYRFYYLLPFDDRRVLVEDTCYSDGAHLSGERQRAAIADYATRQGWQIERVEREEHGVLPITLRYDAKAFWADIPTGVPTIGLRAMRFHPLTGYSLPHAVRSADLIAAHWRQGPQALDTAIRNESLTEAAAHGFYRLLARMLFEAAAPDERRHVMARFYTLPEPLIERFYAGQSTWADKLRVLSGRPPVPVHKALRCLPGNLKERPL